LTVLSDVDADVVGNVGGKRARSHASPETKFYFS